ncbi:piggyBac transposable element-derived protein 3-like [Eupeodes corollae]|uniref:piggyBac transposable element-derived protein 3-like n=1 Tax=Eupeodes corollae TaxID=290404 RepID=UPI00249056A1|nr:piggyBac transposable element-derived protein 3-like [Eupeodes corollae]
MSGVKNVLFNDDEMLAMVEDLPSDNNENTDLEDDDEVDLLTIRSRIRARAQFNMDPNEAVLQDQLEDLPGEEILDNRPGCSHWKKNIREDEKHRQWKAKDSVSQIPEFSLPEGPVPGLFESCVTTTDFFVSFLEGALDNIVYQSNLYAVQKNKLLDLKKGELLAFIGINFLMGYHKLPSWRHFWSESQDLGVSLVGKAMSRNRFDAILSNLHVNDNSCIPKDNKDRLFKLRPLIEYLNEKFGTAYHGRRQLSVDESMILFKGRSSMKQYNPMKPVKRGYKLWCLADQYGYIKKISIYQGKDEKLENKYATYGLGERVVLSLTEKEWGKEKIICFDNYFSSVKLLEKLKNENTLACGTIRANRRGNPTNLRDERKMKRGDFDYRSSTHGISFYKWKDTKTVLLASNYHGNELTTVARRDKSGVQHEVSCPTVVKDYNTYMGGVDHADQLRAAYGLDHRSKKWWHRLFWGIIEICFVNFFIVHGQMNEKISLLEYKRCVTLGLLTQKDLPVDKRSLSRKSNNDEPAQCTKKRRGKGESVSKDVRLGNLAQRYF